MTSLKPHKSSNVSAEQITLLRAVDSYSRENDCPPTWTELAEMTKLRRTTLRDRAVRLVQLGHLRSNPGSHRSLRITNAGKRALRKQPTQKLQEPSSCQV